MPGSPDGCGHIRDVAAIWRGLGQVPTLWWPEDRAWFVHTEIDATSTYLGGSRQLVETLVGEQVLESFEVEADDPAVL